MSLSVAGKAESGKSKCRQNVDEAKKRVLAEIHAALDEEPFQQLVGNLVEARSLAEKEEVLVEIRQVVMGRVTQIGVATERGYQGPYAPCLRCEGRARFVRHESKGYLLLTGEVELERSLYRCGCGHQWRPLDEMWKLPSGRLSQGVERVVSLVGGLVPFASAQNVLWETARVSVSATTIRATTDAIGAEMNEEIVQRIEAVARDEVVECTSPAEVLVVGADGAMINTREEGWKETKVGRALQYRKVSDDTLALERSGYVAHLGSVEEFRPKLDVEVQCQGAQGREATLFLGDGAPWIWEMAAEIMPHATQVLDYYHLKEHVYDAAKALFGDGSDDGAQWAEKVSENQLRRGEIDTALESIERTGKNNKVHEEARTALVRYIQTHRERMPYPEMESRGYPIGSGCIESACKQIVVKRHKQSGMRWSKTGGQHMLNIAAYSHSERWEEFWARRRAA